MLTKLTYRALGRTLLLLYFLSGLVSVAYEVLWVRMLSLQFGVSIFGVVITVSAFMAGLGVGSIVGRRISSKSRQPLMLYGLLEGGVAILTVLMPWLLQLGEPELARIGISSGLGVWYSLQLLAIGVLLFLPALLMGIAFPVILRAIKDTPVGLGQIYGLNAFGAAIGALFPLLLLPRFGWLDAMHIVAATGGLLGGTAMYAAYLFRQSFRAEQSESETTGQSPGKYILLSYAGIGAAALMLEIGWTRLFGMILLRTEYVLAIILAVFLGGMGFGSVIARHLKNDKWFIVMPVLASGFSILSLWLIPSLSEWAEATRDSSFLVALAQQGALLAVVTFPVTLVFGAWLPLLTRRFGGGGGGGGGGGALLYGVNSLGAAAGALLAGFLLTPLIGTSATLVMASLSVLVLGLLWSSGGKAWFTVPVLVLIAYPVMSMPRVEQLLPQLYHDTVDVYSHEDAIAITHVVEKKDGQRLLLADLQRMDASSDPAAVEVQKNQARLPLLLHPAPKTVLFLGLGTGISAAGSLAFPGLQRTAVELSQGAIDAAQQWFATVNDNVVDHLQIIHDDARHFLMSDNHQYDVIIGDLFHPDLVGRSALLSVQQFQRAQQHLSVNGVFVQWIALNQFDVGSLDIVLRSFQKVFPEAMVFVDAFRMALVGSKGLSNSQTLLANLARMDGAHREAATGGEGAWTWLGRYWGHLPVKEGPVQEEWAPLIEFRLPYARYNGDLDLSKLIDYMLQQRPYVKKAADELQVNKDDFAAFERAYIGTELAQRSWLALLREQTKEGERLLKLAYDANPKDRWIGFAVADNVMAMLDAGRIRNASEHKVLESVLRIRPDHAEALKRLWRLELRAGDTGAAQKYRLRLSKISPLDRDVRQAKY
jgi:spermidine synthase